MGTAVARSTGPQQPAMAATAAELESARAAQAEYEQLRRAGSRQPSKLSIQAAMHVLRVPSNEACGCDNPPSLLSWVQQSASCWEPDL